jgi:hypothetical protein
VAKTLSPGNPKQLGRFAKTSGFLTRHPTPETLS